MVHSRPAAQPQWNSNTLDRGQRGVLIPGCEDYAMRGADPNARNRDDPESNKESKETPFRTESETTSPDNSHLTQFHLWTDCELSWPNCPEEHRQDDSRRNRRYAPHQFQNKQCVSLHAEETWRPGIVCQAESVTIAALRNGRKAQMSSDPVTAQVTRSEKSLKQLENYARRLNLAPTATLEEIDTMEETLKQKHAERWAAQELHGQGAKEFRGKWCNEWMRRPLLEHLRSSLEIFPTFQDYG
ncbi:hypothetical protein QAD02_000338 [Eretmocerus hayati]|uniref:Uncharacterized protein n=1 Tax=Eretmocerus hayati TaxID=131215 RepID=A0ACC2NFG9_9HYME|nr:hypothetical protein QAD02_000338 [Eretmocerus hayati]